MAQLNWSKELNTDIPVIDNQHRRIVEYINNLHHAIEAGDREEVGEVLEELVDYTLSHFTFEEDLMEKSHYPFVSAHKKVHKLFTKRVGDYVQRFEMGEDVARQLHTTLKTWLVNHIQHDDADYAESVLEMMKKESGRDGFFKRLFG